MADFTWYVLSFTSLCCVIVSVQAPDPHVFIYKRVGDSVTLQCNNVLKEYTQCSSVTWIYGRDRLGTVKLVAKGRWRQDLSGTKASRLSLQPDCFLNISNITVGDAGRYDCRQYTQGIKYGPDETIDLSVLSGITQEDVFTCSVHSYERACLGVSLRWSDQGTSDQKSAQETPGQCVVRRPNTQPLDSAGLRCLLMKDGVEKTSVDFASKDQNIHSQTNITSRGPVGTGPKEHFIYLAVAVGTVLLVLIVAVLVLRRKKSTGNKQSPPMCVEDPDTMGSPGQGEPTQRLSYDQGEPDGGSALRLH